MSPMFARRSLPAAALAVAAFPAAVLAAPAPAQPRAVAAATFNAATAAAAPRCATAPRKPTFRRIAGQPAGILRWRAPRGARGAITYRVLRNGKTVGQVTVRRAKVAVRPGARYRFTIAVVRGGRMAKARCRALLRVRVRVAPPSVPRGVVVSVASDRAVLSWNASTPGDGKLAGYRVARDGQTFRQLKSTQATVPLASGRSYRLSVRSVDTRGHASAPAALDVSTRRDGPSAPTGLRAAATSETDIRLVWNAADAGAGRITGYRVFRDGVLLGQAREAEMMVPRLRTAQAYTFTVVAVNSFGYLSAPSRALTVSTESPPPTTGKLHAFLLASTGSSFAAFRAHYREIGTLYPTYFECNRSTGAIEGKDDPQITQFARLRQVEVLARYDCQSGATLHKILGDAALRQRTLDGLLALVTTHGYDGINLDFESGFPADRAALTTFVADLAGRLHAIGRKLTVDVRPTTRDDPAHPSSGFYNYPAIAASADTVFVMAWGIHWSTSAPGALAEWTWLNKVVDYVSTLGSPERYVFGAPMYGFDWAANGGSANPGVPYEHDDIMALAARVGVTPGRDESGREGYFAYTDAGGVGHRVWYLDARAIRERIDLFRSRGYQAGLWRLGREDQTLWSGPGIGG